MRSNIKRDIKQQLTRNCEGTNCFKVSPFVSYFVYLWRRSQWFLICISVQEHALFKNNIGSQRNKTYFRNLKNYITYGRFFHTGYVMFSIVNLRFVPLYSTATRIPFKVFLLWLIQQWSSIVLFCHQRCRAVQRDKSQTHYRVSTNCNSYFRESQWKHAVSVWKCLPYESPQPPWCVQLEDIVQLNLDKKDLKKNVILNILHWV